MMLSSHVLIMQIRTRTCRPLADWHSSAVVFYAVKTEIYASGGGLRVVPINERHLLFTVHSVLWTYALSVLDEILGVLALIVCVYNVV